MRVPDGILRELLRAVRRNAAEREAILDHGEERPPKATGSAATEPPSRFRRIPDRRRNEIIR
jgi:hypothetical protein